VDISKRIVEHLEQFVTQEPKGVILDSTGQKGYVVGIPAEAEGPDILLTLADFDRYSVTVRNLKVSYNNLAKNGSKVKDYLRQRAKQITRRVTYLEEPLELLELDAGAGVAQLRSNAPSQDNETVIYWEALIQIEPHPTVSLARYRWTPDRREREVLVYPATFATLGRIAQDLADSLAEES
jgi:hypothetical protein